MKPPSKSVLSTSFSSFLHWYYNAPDHPCKMRLWGWLRRLQCYRRMQVRYEGQGWITLDERDLLQREIFTSGHYEREVRDSLFVYADSQEVIWDVGANVGSFAVAGMLDPRAALVVCFEPDPANRAVLEMNLSLNCGRYRIEKLALSDREEIRRLSPGPLANRGLSSLDRSFPGSKAVEVHCERADDLVASRRLPAPTLMKVDVEGWELPVFRGAQAILETNPPKAIVFEAASDPTGSMTSHGIRDFLESRGYHISWIRRPSGLVDERENYLAVHGSSKSYRGPI